jgi:serine protease Do
VQSASSGSGFIITDDGYIVTNYHVISGGTSVSVTLNNGTTYQAQVIGGEEDYDIAVLKVDPGETKLKSVVIGQSSNLLVGEDIVAIGNPLGDGISFSDGIVSDAARVMPEYALPSIVNTASISQGSSGGALFNEYGEVIAVTSGAFASGNEMYLAVPIDPAIEGTLIDADNTPFDVFLWELPFLTN